MSELLRPQETQPTPEQLLHAGSEFLQHFGVEVSPIDQPEKFLKTIAQLDPRYQGGRELVAGNWKPTKPNLARLLKGSLFAPLKVCECLSLKLLL